MNIKSLMPAAILLAVGGVFAGEFALTNNALQNKISAKFGRKKPTVVQQSEIPAPETKERNVDALLERLEIIKHHI